VTVPKLILADYMDSPESKRFVSLHGFYAVTYPATWIQETDEHGHYLLYNQSGGSGVTRFITLDNEYTGEDSEKQALLELFNQNQSANPQLLAINNKRFLHYVKDHDLNGAMYTVYYWVSAYANKVLLIAYTVQQGMKEMPVSVEERAVMEQILADIEFLNDTASHG
jgi:hypothetical protein